MSKRNILTAKNWKQLYMSGLFRTHYILTESYYFFIKYILIQLFQSFSHFLKITVSIYEFVFQTSHEIFSIITVIYHYSKP